MARLLCVLLATLTGALALAAPAHARVPADFFGVMADGPLLHQQTDLAREAGLMRGAGVSSARVAFYWREMQIQPDGPVDFTATDRIVEALARSRVRVLPVLVRAPAWATGGDEREGAVPDSAAYARYVAAVVRRYGVRGTFWQERPGVPPMRMRRFQVWNEPGIDKYWLGDPWPSTYVALLRAAHRAIKAEDPRAVVVMAGLTNFPWRELQALYAAGARGLFDAAAIHPFSWRVANVVKIVRLSRDVMRRNRDSRVPLLLTEVSYSSAKGRPIALEYGWETTERGQATRVRDVLRALARERRSLRIGGVWWYSWLSPELGSNESFNYSGLRRMRDGRPVGKPAYAAFKRTVRQLRSR